MKISVALASINHLYIEAAPLIYYVEENAAYIDQMDAIMSSVETLPIEALSSVILLIEVITHPLRLGRTDLVEAYRDILLENGRFRLIPVSAAAALSAADLRARYNLRTPDALHVATALEAGCDAFLTNDLGIKRVAELRVLVLDELELDLPT